MKLSVGEESSIILEEVFSSVILKTEHGEEIAICMRDTGFEFMYQGEWYSAKQGYVESFKKSVRDNYLLSELQKHTEECNCVSEINQTN